MKSTDLARNDRELRRAEKKKDVLERKMTRASMSVGDYINQFHELFFYDAQKIYNIDQSEEIFELLEEMKMELPEKQWENVIRKAVKKTQVADKETPINELKHLADI